MLASVMLVASLLWLGLGHSAPAWTSVAMRCQIIPSAIQSCLATTVCWLIATLLLGRIYCATVCPVGALQYLAARLGRKFSGRRSFRYEQGSNARFIILIIYLASLVAGIIVAGFILEPWNIMRNVMSAVQPQDAEQTWKSVGLSVSIGIAAGFAGLAAILIWAWRKGSDFCTSICPIGTAMGTLHSQTLMHIAIDPDKCTGCMRCEDVCSAKCIKVTERRVDNARCLRCFDCTAVCPDDAIRFQLNKDRQRQTPMLIEN